MIGVIMEEVLSNRLLLHSFFGTALLDRQLVNNATFTLHYMIGMLNQAKIILQPRYCQRYWEVLRVKKICYKYVGCFKTASLYPFYTVYKYVFIKPRRYSTSLKSQISNITAQYIRNFWKFTSLKCSGEKGNKWT